MTSYHQLDSALSWLGPAVVVDVMIAGSTRQCGTTASAVASFLTELGHDVTSDDGARRYPSHFDLAVKTEDRGWVSVDPTAIQFHAPNSPQDAEDMGLRDLGLDPEDVTDEEAEQITRRYFAPTVAWSADAFRDGASAFEIQPAPHIEGTSPRRHVTSSPKDWGYREATWVDYFKKRREWAKKIAAGRPPRILRRSLWTEMLMEELR